MIILTLRSFAQFQRAAVNKSDFRGEINYAERRFCVPGTRSDANVIKDADINAD